MINYFESLRNTLTILMCQFLLQLIGQCCQTCNLVIYDIKFWQHYHRALYAKLNEILCVLKPSPWNKKSPTTTWTRTMSAGCRPKNPAWTSPP